jgi:hypothetical protein
MENSMSKTLDDQIFNQFVKTVEDKKILTNSRLDELKKFLGKELVSEEDWNLLVDKECLPREKETKNGK